MLLIPALFSTAADLGSCPPGANPLSSSSRIPNRTGRRVPTTNSFLQEWLNRVVRPYRWRCSRLSQTGLGWNTVEKSWSQSRARVLSSRGVEHCRPELN
jgi:hypothetical protein